MLIKVNRLFLRKDKAMRFDKSELVDSNTPNPSKAEGGCPWRMISQGRVQNDDKMMDSNGGGQSRCVVRFGAETRLGNNSSLYWRLVDRVVGNSTSAITRVPSCVCGCEYQIKCQRTVQ